MERDRAPLVVSYHAKLAWSATNELVGCCRVDRGDHDQERPQAQPRTRPQFLCQGRQSRRRRNRGSRHPRPGIPSGRELHHLASSSTITCAKPDLHCKPRSSRRHLRIRLVQTSSSRAICATAAPGRIDSRQYLSPFLRTPATAAFRAPDRCQVNHAAQLAALLWTTQPHRWNRSERTVAEPGRLRAIRRAPSRRIHIDKWDRHGSYYSC